MGFLPFRLRTGDMLLVLLVALAGDSVRVILPHPHPATIRLQLVSTLQGDSLSGIMTVTRAGPDLIVAGDGTPLYRFELRTGRLLETLTRDGEGPGETRGPLYLETMPGDSVLLYDQSLQRFSIYAPRSYRFVRSLVLPGRSPTATVPYRGGVLVASRTAPREGVGYMLHEFDGAGRWRRSYGGHPSGRLDTRGLPRLLVTPAVDGGVWIVTQTGPFRLERLDSAGRTTAVYQYGPETELREADPKKPPPSRMGLWQASPGLLWVVTSVADRQYPEGMQRVSNVPGHGREALALVDPVKAFDRVLEAIDPRTGQLLARLRVDGFFNKVLPGGYVLVDEEDRPAGEPRFTVNRIVLQAQSSNRR